MSLAVLSSGLVLNYWLPLPYEPLPWGYFWPGFFLVTLFGIALFEPRLATNGVPGRALALVLVTFLTFFALAQVLTNSIMGGCSLG